MRIIDLVFKFEKNRLIGGEVSGSHGVDNHETVEEY